MQSIHLIVDNIKVDSNNRIRRSSILKDCEPQCRDQNQFKSDYLQRLAANTSILVDRCI